MTRISARNRDQLIELLQEFQIELPEIITKKTLIAALEEHDITDEKLKLYANKEELEKDQEKNKVLSGMVVVRMDGQNPFVQFKEYKFTLNNRMVLMSESEANELISSMNGFHKASREEVEQYYKI